jgi:hypothetical protein
MVVLSVGKCTCRGVSLGKYLFSFLFIDLTSEKRIKTRDKLIKKYLNVCNFIHIMKIRIPINTRWNSIINELD